MTIKTGWKDYPDGFYIKNWIDAKRQQYRAGLLTEERIKMLESIPGWSWNQQESVWNRYYQLSLKHGLVEFRTVLSDGTKLGIWQRNMRMNGGNNRLMTPERKKLLSKIPGWTWKSLRGKNGTNTGKSKRAKKEPRLPPPILL